MTTLFALLFGLTFGFIVGAVFVTYMYTTDKSCNDCVNRISQEFIIENEDMDEEL